MMGTNGRSDRRARSIKEHCAADTASCGTTEYFQHKQSGVILGKRSCTLILSHTSHRDHISSERMLKMSQLLHGLRTNVSRSEDPSLGPDYTSETRFRTSDIIHPLGGVLISAVHG